MPNTLDYSKDGSVDWKDNFVFNRNQFGLFNIKTLAEKTGYNFLFKIPSEIRDVIENLDVNDIKAKLNALDTQSASLMAVTGEELSPLVVGTLFNMSIGHSGTPDQIEIATQNVLVGSGPSEVSISQIGIFKVVDFSTNETSTNRMHTVQVSSAQIRSIQASMIQVGGEQVSISENSFGQISPTQISSKQISPSQISPSQIDLFKISPSQINTSQVSAFKSADYTTTSSVSFRDANQFNSSKVTLTSVVLSQQIVSSDFPNHRPHKYCARHQPNSRYNRSQ